MKFPITPFRALLLTCWVAALAACGSGTSPSAEQSATTTKTLASTLRLVDTAGANRTRVDEGERLTAVVRVNETTTTESNGRVLSSATVPAANATVTLTATGSTATPASALTDAAGEARFGVVAGPVAGAFQLSSEATRAGATNASATLAYMVERIVQPKIEITLRGPNGAAITETTPGTPITITVLAQQVRVNATGVIDQLEPAAGVAVQLSADEGQFQPSQGRVVTNAAGLATAILLPGVREGRLTLSADATIGGKPTATTTSIFVRVPRVFLGGGTPFVSGRVQLDPPEIEAGGRATVIGRLIGEDGRDFNQPVTVTLTSACAANQAATLISPVLAAGARVSSTYAAGTGCVGVDTITLVADIPGQPSPVTATGTITVRAPRASGIVFVSAEPSVIALRGRGAAATPERSQVTFRVLSSTGIPVPSEPVAFNLTTLAGGLRLVQNATITDANGLAVATVESGNIATTFAVIARVPSTGEQVQSSQLVVSTGGADQDSFSLSVGTFNIEGGNFDGESTSITLRAADRFNNPVPDGTRLIFTTEGGAVQPNCQTSAGACSVELISQSPRPTDGRVTVLARTEGSETFVDANGNGAFDTGEAWDDLAEAFRDDNENGLRDAAEPFIDTNTNGTHDPANGRFDGAPCGNATCGSGIDVRRSTVIVLSTSRAVIDISPSFILVDELSPQPLQVRISDLNGNLPPAGSTVTITADNGELIGDGSFVIGNSNARGPLVYSAAVIGDGTPSTGRINVVVTTPNNVATQAQATLTDITVCGNTATLPPPPGCDQGSAQVGTITLAPSQIAVAPGTTTESSVAISVRGAGSPGLPFRGVTPLVACTNQGARGITPSVVNTISPTGDDGTTNVRIEVVASASAEGQARCTVRVGDVEAVLPINGPATGTNTAASIALQPNSVVLTPSTTRTVTLLGTVLSAAMPATPVINAAVNVRCETVNATGLTLTPPAAPLTTNANGQVSIAIAVVTGASITGQGACEITSGAARSVVTFAP